VLSWNLSVRFRYTRSQTNKCASSVLICLNQYLLMTPVSSLSGRILNNVTFISGSLSFPCLFNWAGHCQHFSDSHAVTAWLWPVQCGFLIIITFQNRLSLYTSLVADCNVIPLAFIQNFLLACQVKKSTNYPCQDVSQIFPCICCV